MNTIKQWPRSAYFSPFSGMLSPLFNTIDQIHGSDDLPHFAPRVNVREDATSFKLEVVAPGYAKEDLKLHVEEGTLTISAEKKTGALGENERWTRREFGLGGFSRSFRLPELIDLDAITAEHANGVLTVVLPKPVASKPVAKEIRIA